MKLKKKIQAVIIKMMDRVLNRVLVEDPFIPEMHHAKKPLYAALVPDEIFKGSHFERRFVTPFGHVWEKLSLIVATEAKGSCIKGYRIDGTIKEGRLKRIHQILNELEHKIEGNRRKPNWDNEIEYVLKGKGNEVPISVECDIYIEDIKTGEKFACELKGPLPNSDQTKVSKEKILKLYAMTNRQIDEAYFVLPYNPYGKKLDYNWKFPARWFDMQNDKTVLIGDEYWNKLGGDDTYKALIEAVNELSVKYKTIIYKEFLNIEVDDINSCKLK